MPHTDHQHPGAVTTSAPNSRGQTTPPASKATAALPSCCDRKASSQAHDPAAVADPIRASTPEAIRALHARV